MLELVDSLDLKSSGIYSRGGSSPPEATTKKKNWFKFYMKVLITGGAGFLGSNLCYSLIKLKSIDKIYCLDSFIQVGNRILVL